jgi:hypothetical protein
VDHRASVDCVTEKVAFIAGSWTPVIQFIVLSLCWLSFTGTFLERLANACNAFTLPELSICVVHWKWKRNTWFCKKKKLLTFGSTFWGSCEIIEITCRGDKQQCSQDTARYSHSAEYQCHPGKPSTVMNLCAIDASVLNPNLVKTCFRIREHT